MTIDSSIVRIPIEWERTGDAFYPYRATLEGQSLTIRVGDFPEEYVYTLIAEGVEIVCFDIWPGEWKRTS